MSPPPRPSSAFEPFMDRQLHRVLDRHFDRQFITSRVTVRSKRTCRICGCTNLDCRQCIQKTGKPCHWLEPDLCSACENTHTPGLTELTHSTTHASP